MKRSLLILAILLPVANLARGAEILIQKEWKVEGATRQAMIFSPPTAKKTPCPVVFAFHGHGGTMRHAARTFAYQKHWPEAIVVYMQGLNTPGMLTDREGKRPGWQKGIGDQNDRDLKFFDAVLATLKKEYKVDQRRVYATGHSNGGAFTYLLWAVRGDVFAAVAPCAAAARGNFTPKPVLHMAGENDRLVRFEWQKRTIDELRRINGCDEGKPWGEHCTLYPSKTGTPVVAYIHPGGHELPENVPPVIVKFFKEHAKADKK